MDITSLFQNQNSVQFLVDQFMRFEQGPKNALLDRKDTVNNKLSVLSELDSKLTALKSRTDRMTDSLTDYFAARKAESSNTDVLNVSASSAASIGNHTISVSRLAADDTRVSDQYTSTNSDFTSYTTDQTFQIEVAHPTDADASNRVFISVTVAASAFSGDNASVLKAVSDAVNTAMDNAVAADTITSDERVQASVVNEQSGTSRLKFKSEQSGYTYRMGLDSSALLTDLGINNNAQTSGTTGGYLHVVGTSEATSQLNSQLNIDGLTYYRDTTTVTDAIEGVTLKLGNTFSQTETVSVSTDSKSVKDEVNGFITAYNDVITNLRKNAQYDSTTGKDGALSTDYTYKNISSDLRDISQSAVTDITYSQYNLLYDIGIEADQQGKLSIVDEDKFTTAVETNSKYVSDIFNGSDGIATRIKDYVDKYTKSNGTISQSKKALNTQITNLNDRIDLQNTLLDQKQKQLFDEFTKMQQVMNQLQSQQSFFGLFAGGG